jgi:hypothetical protein
MFRKLSVGSCKFARPEIARCVATRVSRHFRPSMGHPTLRFFAGSKPCPAPRRTSATPGNRGGSNHGRSEHAHCARRLESPAGQVSGKRRCGVGDARATPTAARCLTSHLDRGVKPLNPQDMPAHRLIRSPCDGIGRIHPAATWCRNVPLPVLSEACRPVSSVFPRIAALHIMLSDWGDVESPANSCPANRIPKANWGCDKIFVQTPDRARWVTLCLRCH